jgi:hypothetical protein
VLVNWIKKSPHALLADTYLETREGKRLKQAYNFEGSGCWPKKSWFGVPSGVLNLRRMADGVFMTWPRVLCSCILFLKNLLFISYVRSRGVQVRSRRGYEEKNVGHIISIWPVPYHHQTSDDLLRVARRSRSPADFFLAFPSSRNVCLGLFRIFKSSDFIWINLHPPKLYYLLDRLPQLCCCWWPMSSYYKFVYE